MPDRPDWDTLMMASAFLVAMRSPDEETKHGAVVVDDRHRILGTGFNGFPRGARDAALPRTRPEKYPYVIHAEVNALINSRAIPDPALCTIYVTGEPCNECFKMIGQYGIGRIVYGCVGSVSIDDNEQHDMIRERIADGLGVETVQWSGHIGEITRLLHATAEYAELRAAEE